MTDDTENARLSPAEAALYLGTILENLAQWRRNKSGPHYTYERIVYLKKDLDAWIAKVKK